MDTISSRIKQLMVEMKLKNYEMAEILGVSPTVMSNLKDEDRDWKESIILRFIEKYGFKLGDMLTTSDQMVSVAGLSQEDRESIVKIINVFRSGNEDAKKGLRFFARNG